MLGACGFRPCARTHQKKKKGLLLYMPVGWGGHQKPQINIGLHLSSCWVAFRPAVLSAARIKPSVSWYLEISFGLRRPSPQAFTPFGGGVIARHLRKCWARVGSGFAPGPTKKKPSATHARWVGRHHILRINIGDIRTVRDFLPFLCNSIFLV